MKCNRCGIEIKRGFMFLFEYSIKEILVKIFREPEIAHIPLCISCEYDFFNKFLKEKGI